MPEQIDDLDAYTRELERVEWIEQDFEFTSARDIVIQFLERTVNGGELSRLDAQRIDLTRELADYVPLYGDAETWARITGMVEQMLDDRLVLLAIHIPEALLGVRANWTLH